MSSDRLPVRLSHLNLNRWFWIAGSLWVSALALVVWVVVVDVLARDTGRSIGGAALLSFAEVSWLLVLVTVGAFVGWVRPKNPVGWLLLADGLVWTTGVAHERYVSASNGVRPGAAVAAAFFDGAGWVLGLGLMSVVLLVFPTGREPTRRWRLVRWLIVGGGGLLAVSNLLTPGELPSWPGISNPFGVEALAEVAPVSAGVAGPVFFAGFSGGLISVVVRFRRSSGVERQQLRWLVFSVAVMFTGFGIGALLTAIGLPGEPWFNTVPMFTVPVAVGIAVLRHRVWDLDLVIYRTLTYGFVAVAITAIYVMMIAAVGALIGGGARNNLWLAVLATAMAAAVFQPAREAAQTGIRRLLFSGGPDTSRAPVRIRTLGGFRVERGGQPVTAAQWQSKKARQLLKMLVSRRGRPVHREQLMEALWPGEGTERLANRLAVATSTVRAVLDPEKTHPSDHFVKGDQETLRLDLDHVAVDIEEFLTAAEIGLRNGGPEIEIAEGMYLGDFLEEDLYEEWAQPLREEARATYLAVLRARAEIEQENDPDAAVTAFLKILEVDPWDEPAHLAIVSLLKKAGRHGEARRAHRRYSTRMEELGVDPVSI